MKRKLLLTCVLLSAFFCGKIAAQLPKESTEDKPIWYYIQVVGSGNTADRVLTANGDNVEGLPLSYDVNTMNRQMWRFEIVDLPARGWEITNKATKKKLSVVYDETQEIRRAVLSDNPSTVWRFPVASGFIYNIMMSIEPSEGTAGDVYLFQTTNTNNYTLSFTGSSNRTNNNARFTFALNDNPISSTDTQITWMHIQNAKTKNYLTDESDGSDAYFSMEELIDEETETSQHWKLVDNGKGHVNFINRATGNAIDTRTNLDRYYFPFNTQDPAETDGWNIESLGLSQFAIFTTTWEGIVNYWYATTFGESTMSYTDGYVQNSPYAWIFTVAAEEDLTNIENPTLWEDNIRVYSYNKRIYVEGHQDYRIITVYGMPVRNDQDLPTGIYLVTVKGRTTKVIVK